VKNQELQKIKREKETNLSLRKLLKVISNFSLGLK